MLPCAWEHWLEFIKTKGCKDSTYSLNTCSGHERKDMQKACTKGWPKSKWGVKNVLPSTGIIWNWDNIVIDNIQKIILLNMITLKIILLKTYYQISSSEMGNTRMFETWTMWAKVLPILRPQPLRKGHRTLSRRFFLSQWNLPLCLSSNSQTGVGPFSSAHVSKSDAALVSRVPQRCPGCDSVDTTVSVSCVLQRTAANYQPAPRQVGTRLVCGQGCCGQD